MTGKIREAGLSGSLAARPPSLPPSLPHTHTQSQAIQVSANRMPPGGSPTESLSFIITALGYADDTYG